jgi:DNA polymerase III alpha subunit
MAFATVEDDTKVASVVIFPGVYEKHKTILIKDNIFIMTVKADPKGLQALSLKEYRHE